MENLINKNDINYNKSKNGIFSFLKENDDFYEGAYTATTKWSPKTEKWYHIFPILILNYGYVYNVRKYITKGSTVLELGCGGGIQYFNDRYNMIGLDLSFKSLEICPYNIKLQADASKLPLKDKSVDAVISSFFWEHIPASTKNTILQECKRVLKPEGKIVFFYDVETCNPLISKLKTKDISLYNKLFIEKDGHFGYHTPEKNLEIFENNSFKKLRHLGLERTSILRISELQKLYNSKIISKSYYLSVYKIYQYPTKYIYELLIQAVNYLGKSIIPTRYSRIIVSVFEKRNEQ